MNPTRILLTGATGFIGTRLCERLHLLHRLPFRALVRTFNRASRIARLDAEMAGGDLMKPGSIRAALEGCDTVVHMAHSDDANGPKETRNVIEASLQARVKRFVHVSSFFVHGTAPGPECAREDTAAIGRHGNAYADSKAEGEELVQRAIRRDGLPAVILRPTVVFGPYSPFVLDVVQAAKSGELGLIDDGRGVCNAVFVDDVCAAIHTALTTDTGVGGAFFVNADAAVTWRDFNVTFARMANPHVTFRDFKSPDIQARLDAQRPTIASNFRDCARLLASPDLHRQLSTVPAIGWTIFHAKELLKKGLSGKTVASLKRSRGAPTAPATDAPVKWPSGGRLVREISSVAFSNEKARRVLGWKPAFTFQQGAELTRLWLEFARYIPGPK